MEVLPAKRISGLGDHDESCVPHDRERLLVGSLIARISIAPHDRSWRSNAIQFVKRVFRQPGLRPPSTSRPTNWPYSQTRQGGAKTITYHGVSAVSIGGGLEPILVHPVDNNGYVPDRHCWSAAAIPYDGSRRFALSHRH